MEARVGVFVEVVEGVEFLDCYGFVGDFVLFVVLEYQPVQLENHHIFIPLIFIIKPDLLHPKCHELLSLALNMRARKLPLPRHLNFFFLGHHFLDNFVDCHELFQLGCYPVSPY